MILLNNESRNTTVALVTVKSMTKTDKAVTLTVGESSWDKEAGANVERELKVAFFDSDKVPVASRLRKLDLQPGTPLVLTIFDIDGKCYGNNFLLNGKRKFTYEKKNGGTAEINVFLGNCVNPKKYTKRGSSEPTIVSVSFPNHLANDETEWNNITFTDSEYHQNLYERASKCWFDDNDIPRNQFACVVTGSDNPTTREDGTEMKNRYFASQFTLLSRPPKKQ